jgi:hypothetical protein
VTEVSRAGVIAGDEALLREGIAQLPIGKAFDAIKPASVSSATLRKIVE